MAKNEVMKVDDIDLSKRNSAFNVPESEGIEQQQVPRPCYLNGKPVGEGSLVCVKHEQYVCTKFGYWQKTGQKC